MENGDNPGTGRRARKYQVFKGGKRAAEDALKQMEEDAKNGAFLDAAKLTVGEFLRSWLEDYGSVRLADTTLRRYRQIITGSDPETGGHPPC